MRKQVNENAPQNDVTNPEIRFKGFEGDWELKKLDSLGEFNPKAIIPEIFEYVDLESVVGTEMVSHRTVSKSTAPSRAQRAAQEGDLFFQTVRPYQKNNYLFALPNKDYVFSTGYAQIRPFNDGDFLLALVQRQEFVKAVMDNCTGTSYPAINSLALSQILVYEPPLPIEEEKIGAYFKGLDKLIHLYQRKHEKLSTLKQAMLQKMFPQNGATKPEIRFKGFDSDWVEMALGEVLITHPFKPYIADPSSSGPFEVLQQGDNPVSGYSSGIPFREYEHVILFGDHTLSLYRPTKPFFVASDGIKILGNRIGLFRDYLYSLLVAHMPPSEGYKRHLSILKAVHLPISLDQNEQQKIGNYFRKLDRIITLHATQLEKIKQIKSACMEKMFV